MMCFPISPREKKRERRPTLDFSPKTKRSAKERKKKRIDSQNISKKEKELKRKRERERESVFFKERETFFLLSLSPFFDFGGRSELKSRQTFFVSPRDTDLISLSLFYYFTRR